MTENEATTKWCPHALRLSNYSEDVAFSRDSDGKPAANCIASECMAWCSTGVKWQTEDGRLFDEKREILGDRKSKHVKTGYCGLSGPGGAS